MAEAIAEEYRSSLGDLNFNSKPHINMLTMLAEENVKYASVIVKTIVEHVVKVPPNLKLPSLYLVDSIMKNVGGQYVDLFCDHLVTLFSSVFEKVEEFTRSQLYKLRQTWNDILPKKVLYGIDYNVNLIDPAWPITAQVPPVVQTPPKKSSIHVNPKFLGTPKQATVPVQNPSKPKPNLLKKNNLEVGNKEKEIMEILKKQEELGRQLKEKKEQVRVLEMKKLEMAAKQKKNSTSSVLIQQNAQVKINNNNPRDPRLKKTNTPVVNDKSSASQATLQSVVIVPNVKLPAHENITGNGTPLQKPNSKGDKPTHCNKTFHSKVSPPPINRRTTHTVKKPVKSTVDNSKQTEKPPKDVHSANRDSPNKSVKFPSKKHSLNADEKTVPNPKKVCKPTSKSKQPIQSEAAPVPVSEKRYEAPLPVSDTKCEAAPAPLAEIRVDAPLLFGSEDKDYRQRPAVTPNVRQWTPPDVAPPPNTRVPQEPFYPKQVPDIPSSEPKESFFPRDGIVPPAGSVTRRIPEDSYHAAKTTFNVDRAENENFFQPEPNTFKKVNEQSSFALNNEQPELSYSLAPKPVPTHRVSPPPPKQFTLDGISYTLYFVGKHAFVLLDNNEPREVIFRGPPRLVHIEGQNQPILLGFDGRVVEFDTEGQRNTMHFGTPSREVYVNDLPYEAQFGGSPITVIMQDNKPHWVKLEGPLPQVVLVVPPPELYEEFQRSRGSELSMERRDVDMRMTPSHPLVKTTILPESTKDVDWRQLPAQVPSWEGPKNAVVEPYNEYEPPPNGRNFQEYQNPPMAPNGPWNEDNSRMMSDRGPPPPNRNLDGPWPRPGFHPRIQHERPMRPSPPHTWDLPPPPKIPANLVQTLPALANRPPPTWNPLPPPPSFPGQIHDSVPTTMSSMLPPVSSNSILPAMQPSLTDVGSIYDKLVAAGIIPKAVATIVKDEPKVIKAEDPIKEVKVEVKKEPEDSKELPEPEITLSPKCLRVHYPAVLAALYKGSQCATCGMRFKEIQSEKYSRHLDWHFRMNRKEKDGAKKAYSRRLFYKVKDWVQFKEIEEKEERTPSYFELQAGGLSKTEEQKIQSVPASECGESEKCSVCSEQFQLFWVEEEEEWHLRHAVRHDGEVYHPMCYEDFTRAEEITKRMEEAKAKAEAEELAKKLEEEAAEKAKAEREAAEKAEKEAAEKAEKEAAEKEAAEKAVIEAAEKEAAEKAEKEAAEKAEKEAAEKAEMEAAEKAIAEGAAKVKEEPLSPEGETKSTSLEATDMESVKEEAKEESDKSTLVPVETKSKPAPRPSIDSFLSSDFDSDSFEDEFHPPPPDPRFQNLPKVERGKELSALCTIM